MAISIDSVYKEILNIIKDEDLEKAEKAFEGSSLSSRGGKDYITPREFNILADRAQQDIFENLLHDYKEALVNPDTVQGFKKLDVIREKITPFRTQAGEIDKTTGAIGVSPSGAVYYIESIYHSTSGANTTEYTEVSKEYFSKVRRYSTSKAFLDGTNKKNIIWYRGNHTFDSTPKIFFYPTPTSNPYVDYIRNPQTVPKWNSSVDVNTGTVTYASVGSVDFELHPSSRSSLVNKILYLGGMSAKDPQVSDMALRDEAKNESVKNS